MMKELLGSRGYDVVAVSSASQAEAEIRRLPPDLILSDVIMPGKSGYELCRELKENSATRLIPFVLITGLSDREDRLQGIECGADDFLHKPIFAEELFARVGCARVGLGDGFTSSQLRGRSQPGFRVAMLLPAQSIAQVEHPEDGPAVRAPMKRGLKRSAA